MNMNLSKYLRAVNSLFFIFTLLFSGMAQASLLQRVTRSLPKVSEYKRDKVFSIVEDLDINIEPKNLSENEIRALAYALDDPTSLIKSSSDGLFGSDLYRAFFFSRFDLYRDGDALFTKLFSKPGRNRELPFKKIKRNWENFIDATKSAKRTGVAQIEETDLEAAAISFIHQKFDRYSSSIITDADLPYAREYFKSSGLADESLGMFFQRKFTIAHYINPHFTLTQDHPYHQFVMSMILVDGKVDLYTSQVYRSDILGGVSYGIYSPNHSLLILNPEFPNSINSEEFILKLWGNITEEISSRSPRTGGIYRTSRIYTNVFLDRITKAVTQCLKKDISIESDPFLRAIIQSAREDDRLMEVVNIINNLASQYNSRRIKFRLEEAIQEFLFNGRY